MSPPMPMLYEGQKNATELGKLQTHRIHVWYFYLHLPLQTTVHTGKYAIPMDVMENISGEVNIVQAADQ